MKKKSHFLQKRTSRQVLLLLLLALTTTAFAQDPLLQHLSIEEEIPIDVERSEGDRSGAPIVTTLYATTVTANSATLYATVNPNGLLTAYAFQYGTTTSYGYTSEGGSVSGTTTQTVSITVSGLSSGTTYHFRIRAGNTSGATNGSDKTFTTLSSGNSAPNTPSNPNPSIGATGIATSGTFSWTCTDPDGDDVGYDLYLGTSSSTMGLTASGSGTSVYISGLLSGRKYYWKVVAYDDYDNMVTGPLWYFTTANPNSAPTVPSNPNPNDGATGISTSPLLSWTCTDPDGDAVGYDLYLGASASSMALVTSGSGTMATLTGLNPEQTYYWKVIAYDSYNASIEGPVWQFTTGQAPCFYDCTSGDCGDYGYEMFTAAQYLCNLGIVEGIDGALEPDICISRGMLAKVALFSLYNGESNVPNPLVTDYFPSIYSDLQDNNTYYYKAAKALLYLEYKNGNDLDGISPFDRDRGCFYPEDYIERCLVLKVLLETFNITPDASGANPFADYDPNGDYGRFYGYAKKGYDLGIVQTTTFEPGRYCTRGEAFLYLYRILTNNNIIKPTPNNTENPATSDFFIPANLSPEVVNAMRGVEYGNFNYYEKDFFNIPGYIDLNFGIGYNSYLTEMPDDFYPVKPLGKAWTHTYDMYMNIVIDSYNNSSNYVFHMQNGLLLIYDENLSSITEGNYYDLTHPSTTRYVLKSREQISYTFERQSASDGIYYLTQIKDRNDNAINISYSYGNSHYRITTVSTLGRTLNFYYTSGTDLLYYVKDPMNRKVYFYYTGDQMTSLKDANNQYTNFTYGTMDFEKGLLKEIQLPKGNYVYNNYEQRKLVSMSRISATGNTHTDISISPNYQNGSYTSTVTENLGNRQTISTTYTMNAKNRITNVNDGLYTNVSYEYNISGKPDLVSKMTDNKKSIQTTYTYSSKGLPQNVTTSAGGLTRTTQTEYTSLNDISTFTDAKGNVTQYAYSDGNLTKITDALGNQTNFLNNSYGKITRVTDPSSVVTNYTYDSYGNETEMNIPSISMYFSRTYDDVSRVTSAITSCDCQTTTYTYDNNDNMLTKTDAEGNTTSYSYDANNNLTQITNARGYSTYLSYDDNDFVTSVSFQGATDNYTYNRDGSMATHTDPNGHTFTYTYNSSGEMTSDGYASYSYNTKGQITSVTKDNKSINYSYDAFNRVSSIEYDGKTVSYTYDNNDNILTITYPGSKTVTYTYDAMNRMTSVKDWNNATTTYSYRDDGQLNYYQYPNQVRTTYGYDAGGRVVSQTTKRSSGNGTTVASYNYTYDEFGNHTQETFTEPYETYPSIPSANISYSYNAANRLSSAGALSFGYDNNGNTTSRTGRNYGYDTKNNLTSISGDFTASYTYDGLGNRRSATRNGVTTKYVLDLLGDMSNVLMETDGNGSVKNYYIYGASGLISRIDANNNTRYYVSDYRGSTVAMTDATTSANITHKYQYDDFGKVLQSEEENENLFRYVGELGVMFENDALTFMRARYYDPDIGRFLSEDPIWSTNLYPYADNNSIINVDPDGFLFCGRKYRKWKNATTEKKKEKWANKMTKSNGTVKFFCGLRGYAIPVDNVMTSPSIINNQVNFEGINASSIK